MPRTGDQGKKGKRKGRNKQETLAYAEPSAHGEEVKTPLDLAKVSLGAMSASLGVTGKAWSLESGERVCQTLLNDWEVDMSVWDMSDWDAQWALLRPHLNSWGEFWVPHKKHSEVLEYFQRREQSWGRGWSTRSG